MIRGRENQNAKIGSAVRTLSCVKRASSLIFRVFTLQPKVTLIYPLYNVTRGKNRGVKSVLLISLRTTVKEGFVGKKSEST